MRKRGTYVAADSPLRPFIENKQNNFYDVRRDIFDSAFDVKAYHSGEIHREYGLKDEDVFAAA